jgi:hypothetical protein
VTNDAADTDQNHCHDALQTALLDTASLPCKSDMARITASGRVTRGLVDLRFRRSLPHPHVVLSGLGMARSLARG